MFLPFSGSKVVFHTNFVLGRMTIGVGISDWNGAAVPGIIPIYFLFFF